MRGYDIKSNFPSSYPLDLKISYEEKSASIIEANGVLYQLGERLGRSLNSIVYSALNTESGEFVAIKQFDVTNLSKDQIHCIEQSYHRTKKINHANIVKTIDTFSDEYHFYAIMELSECRSLNDIIKVFGPIPENLASKYFLQVLNALSHLHKIGIMHKNLKTTNLLVDRRGIIKLGDIGYAIDNISQTSPEIHEKSKPWNSIKNNKPHKDDSKSTMTSPEYDIWSLGLTFIELLTGVPPVCSHNPLGAIFSIDIDEGMDIPENISPDFKKLIYACLNKNPSERPNVDKLLKSNYLFHVRKLHRSTIRKKKSGSSSISFPMDTSTTMERKDDMTYRSNIGKYKTFRVKSMKDPKMLEFLSMIEKQEERLELISSDKNHRDVLAFLDSFIDKDVLRDVKPHINLSKEDEAYVRLHEFAMLFETQLKKCLKEKRETVSIANFFRDSLKDLNGDYFQLLSHSDHLKYLHNMSKQCVSTLSESNEAICKTLKRFSEHMNMKMSELNKSKKVTKKIELFLKKTNKLVDARSPRNLQFDILSQHYWNVPISKWDGNKWKSLRVITMELWLIFYRDDDIEPCSILQLPNHLKIVEYDTTLHSKYECFGMQDDMYTSPNKIDFLNMITEKYKTYGLALDIEKKKRN